MLSKLVKYEMKSTARVFLPMYLVLIFFALFSRFAVSDLVQVRFGGNDIFGILSGVMIMGYVFAILSVLIVTYVIIIQRFFKNLTGDEGYLMHTLPVSTHSLIQSKLIGAFIWQFLSISLVFISLFVLFLQPAFIVQELPIFFEELGVMLGFIWGEIGFGMIANTLLFLGMMLISALSSTLMIYAAMSIGHTFKKHRIMGSVVAYMGLSMVSQFVAGVAFSLLALIDINWDFGYITNPLATSNLISGFMLMIIVGELLFSAVWYFTSHYVLTNQLNLE